MNYVNFLFCRMTGGSESLKFAALEECVQAMKLLVEDAKKCYTEEVDNLNEEMLVVDGCFILELLYRDYLLTHPKEETNEESNEITKEIREQNISDPVFGSSLMHAYVQQDLLLLENQLPFFVLEKLFHITVSNMPNRPLNYLLLSDYIVSFFRNMLPFRNRMNSGNKCVAERKRSQMHYHILQFVHDHCLPLDIPKGKYYSEKMPSASDLDYAGVKFVAGIEQDLVKGQNDVVLAKSVTTSVHWSVTVAFLFTDAQSCLGRCFHRARFEIPPLSLYNSTELFLRNLIAFEQCCPGVPCYFTSYVFFMAMLVNSAKDVDVLQKAGIIQISWGPDKNASELFKNLCKEVVLEKFMLTETCDQATKYSKRCMAHVRRKNFATVEYVKSKYFVNPWTFIAFCVGFIIFGMTVAEFVRNFLK
ncbi:UPF0481 protein At3g47200-like [Actinidia eriantha]|uniref:UPF0481 protein At3g47200-like n=1 Tax=Actinidia eriantha TaxID=165200 RepID=UPI002585EF27|nr:UPF0481 protein At3g47200-like [Actinidia eriantha]